MKSVLPFLLAYFCLVTMVTAQRRITATATQTLTISEKTDRTAITFSPLVTSGARGMFWERPDYNSDNFRNERFFNRQFALGVEHRLFPFIRTKGGKRISINAQLHYQRIVWSLTDRFDYALGTTYRTPQSDAISVQVQEVLTTGVGITREETAVGMELNLTVEPHPLFRWSIGGGTALRTHTLRTNVDVSYTENGVRPDLRSAFANTLGFKPYGNLMLEVGGKIYLRTTLRLEWTESNGQEGNGLLYRSRSYVDSYRSISLDHRGLAGRIMVGIGVRL